MSRRYFIGLSSGSSMGGVDAALVGVDGVGLEASLHLGHFIHVPYPREVRDLLRGASSPSTPVAVRNVALLHRVVGEMFAASVRQLVADARCDPRHVWCVGCSGHTLWHEPESRYPGTLNLGMASVVAERTGFTTLSDPRARDLVTGGQGVPLTPLVDWMLFRHATEPRVLMHLGGVITVTAIPPAASPRQISAFHAAPGCLLLDGLMHRLTGGKEPVDVGGKHAVQGRCIEALLERWAAHPLVQRRPPKAITRRDFGDEFIQQGVQWAKQMDRSLHDLLCTATHFVARAATNALQAFVPWRPAQVLLSGGGVRNGLLWRLLEQHLAPAAVEKTDVAGVPCAARKAIAFAALASLAMDSVPGNLPSVTGANGPRLLGSFTPGDSANWSRCLSWMAQQATMPKLAAA